MDGIIFIIVVLLWVGRNLVRLVRWIGKQAKGVNASPPAPMPTREPLRTISRPAGDDAPLVPDMATRAGFVRRERELARPQDAARTAAQEAPMTINRPAAPALETLFSQKDDLLRAFIMREVLEKPRRMTPVRPPQDDPNAPSSSGT